MVKGCFFNPPHKLFHKKEILDINMSTQPKNERDTNIILFNTFLNHFPPGLIYYKKKKNFDDGGVKH